MNLHNTPSKFGIITILLHWIIGLAVISEFAMGLYMTGLNYYDPMYTTLPFLHESIGIVLAVAILLRICWAIINVHPDPGQGVAVWEHRLSKLVHIAMHTLLIAVVSIGYLLSTAEGDGISVFNWFEVPALSAIVDQQESFSSFWHYWLAWTLIGFASLHAIGALKHHFIDKDETLRRMLGHNKG